MATKAERFRYEAQRSGAPAKKTKPAKKKGATPRGSARAPKAVFALEETPKSMPASRKSTRKSKHRQKSATALTAKTLLSKNSPQTRHDIGRPTLRAPR